MQLPPGPRSPFQFFEMLRQRRRDPIGLYESLFRNYGDIVYFSLAGQKFAMLNDPELFEQVLLTEARNTTKSTGYERFKMIVGEGLLVSEGEKWKKQRRLLSWAFSSKHIERIHPVIMQETLEMVSRWEGAEHLDLAEEMNLVTLQVISKSLFGKSQMSESDDIRSALQEMLRYLQTTRHLWIQLFLAPLPVKDKRGLALKIEASLPTKKTKSFRRSIDLIDRLVHDMINERKRLGKQDLFLDTLISATDSEDQTQMDPKQLRDEVVNMLIAGHETTANALTWTWHQILKYPEVYRKLKEEISQEVAGPTPTYAELAKLPYTKAVFEESMRLFPPFWRISRKNQVPLTLKGYDIPTGTNIITSIYTVQRDARYWDDPLVFRPERFLQERAFHKFAFVPFGAGPRACIGSGLAMAEALTILSAAIKHVKFEPEFTADPTYFVSLTLQPKEGCRVRVRKADP